MTKFGKQLIDELNDFAEALEQDENIFETFKCHDFFSELQTPIDDLPIDPAPEPNDDH